MLQAGLIQCLADHADPPVHHVGRRDHVAARFGLDQSLPGEHRKRLVVQHVALVVDQSVLAVRGVRVERDIADHPQLGHGRLDRPHRAAHQVAGIGRLGAVGGLQLRGRDRKQGNRRDAERRGLLQQRQQPVDRQALDARHGRHRLAPVLPVQDEHRPDQVGGVEPGLGNQPS
jgi:hypothetical protein